MRTEFERIIPDEGSSFRLLHENLSVQEFTWDYHYHPEYEIVCVLGATGRRHVGNHLSYYESGDLVLIGPNLPHAGFGYGAVGHYEQVVLQFLDNFLGDSFFNSPEVSGVREMFERSKQGLAFHGETKRIVSERLKKLSQFSHFEKLIELLELFHILAGSEEYTLLNDTGKRYDFNQKDQFRLSKVYQFVEQNYQKAIEIQDVASVASLTVPAFCNYFKKVTNQTFTDFVNEYRINKATNMLTQGETVADACFKSGFNNVSYFGRVFRNMKGRSPSEFGKMIGKRQDLRNKI